tara:strand:- start:126 stop:350 length:225 start_codon:yes stop_codon:yes gene_type:complete
MENKCYVISREQVSNEVDIVECRNEVVARQLCDENRRHYIDSIYLTLDDLRQLSDKVDESVGNSDFGWSTMGTL